MKKILAVCELTVVALLFFFSFADEDTPETRQEHHLEKDGSDRTHGADQEHPAPAISTEEPDVYVVDSALAQNPDMKNWLTNRGFTTEYNMHFTQQDFLKNQAENEDMLAAQTLGWQMLGTERGIAYSTDAARWGSIESLLHLSTASVFVAEGRLPQQRENTVSKPDQHEHSIKALEYLFVAEIRGDNYLAPNNVRRLLNKFTYSPNDISQACVQAAARYADLERARMAEGLPAFENSSPPNISAVTVYSQRCAG